MTYKYTKNNEANSTNGIPGIGTDGLRLFVIVQCQVFREREEDQEEVGIRG